MTSTDHHSYSYCGSFLETRASANCTRDTLDDPVLLFSLSLSLSLSLLSLSALHHREVPVAIMSKAAHPAARAAALFVARYCAISELHPVAKSRHLGRESASSFLLLGSLLGSLPAASIRGSRIASSRDQHVDNRFVVAIARRFTVVRLSREAPTEH